MDAYGQDEDGVTSGQVTFSQEKGTEKGSVKIEAAADDMQELAKVLALAGITLPQARQEELLVPKDKDEPCDACADDEESGNDDDARYSVDKNNSHMIKNKLKQKMINNHWHSLAIITTNTNMFKDETAMVLVWPLDGGRVKNR